MFYKDTYENGYFNRELIKDGYIYEKTHHCYLYEANIPPLLKLFHLQEISPSGWVLLPSNKVKTVNKKTTHCAYEYIISHKHIKKAEKDDIVKYNICSFDIEASSSHGDFPVPIKDYKKLASNILQYYNELQDKENYNIESFEKQISAAFGYEDINYIDKVYPKLKQIGKEQLNNIFDNFIKYIPANDTNRKDYILEFEESDSESDNDDDQPAELIKKLKKVKKYNKNANIFEIITDDKCEYETKVLELNKALTKFYPQLEGDIVTFIGMTFINYSEKKPYIRYIIVKGGCKIPEKYKQWVQENNVKIIEKPTEKGVLLEFTKIMQLENPHIVTGYNINGFDWDFMYKRAKEIGCVHDFLKLSRNKDEVCINKDWRTGEEDIAKNKIILASGEYNLSYVNMPGRIIIDMCVIFRREFTLSSNKLDYVSSYFISDSVKKIEINKENNTTEIFSKNLTGLTIGCFVKFEEISHSVNSYKKGKKFEVLDINLNNASFTICSAEELDLINYKNAMENVALPLYYQGLKRKERQEKAMFHLEKVGLAEWATHLPSELSGGQKQRVAIARALASEPKLLLADEPTGALDTATSHDIMQFLQQLNDEGKTILLVTHEEDIAKMCKRIVRLRDGVIIEDNVIKQVRA